MQKTWKTFLENAGARIQDDRVLGFGDAAAEAKAAVEGDVISDLSHFGVVRVSGDDAQDFLHNQFTNDLRFVSDERGELNSYCTAKGRMLAVFRILRHEGAYCLRLPEEVMEGFLKKLRMFVLMSKVEIRDASNDIMRVGLSGPGVESRLREAVGPVPEAVDGVTHASGLSLMRIPGIQPRFEVYGPEAEVQALWTQLAPTVQPVGHDAWALLDIRAGIPTIYEGTIEAFVPQMTNLQLIGGVSFKKGCYPGQEIVARMQYLGNLKRRMYFGHVDAPARPLPGDNLFSPSSTSGQGAGKVVDARPAPGGGFDLLAVAQIDSVEAGDIRLTDAEGPQLVFGELPYPVEADQTQAS